MPDRTIGREHGEGGLATREHRSTVMAYPESPGPSEVRCSDRSRLDLGRCVRSATERAEEGLCERPRRRLPRAPAKWPADYRRLSTNDSARADKRRHGRTAR